MGSLARQVRQSEKLLPFGEHLVSHSILTRASLLRIIIIIIIFVLAREHHTTSTARAKGASICAPLPLAAANARACVTQLNDDEQLLLQATQVQLPFSAAFLLMQQLLPLPMLPLLLPLLLMRQFNSGGPFLTHIAANSPRSTLAMSTWRRHIRRDYASRTRARHIAPLESSSPRVQLSWSASGAPCSPLLAAATRARGFPRGEAAFSFNVLAKHSQTSTTTR